PPGAPPTPDAPRPTPGPLPVAPRSPARRRLSAPPCAPQLTVVVVNFCQWRNTARLVLQLRRSVAVRTGTAALVVADNYSPAHRRLSAPPCAPRRPGGVLNSCQWRTTARRAPQLRRSVAVRPGTAALVVVDTHPPAPPVARRLRRLRGVTVRRTRRNLGFAR